MNRSRVERPPSFRVDVSSGALLKVVLALGLVWLLIQLWNIVLVVGVALMVAGMVATPIAHLERRGMRRGPAIAVVFLSMFALVGLFAALTVPSLVTQLVAIVDHFPQTREQIAEQLQRHATTAPLAQSVRGATSTELIEKLAGILLSYSTKVAAIIAYGVTALVLALYLVVDRDRMRGTLFALVPRGFHVRLSRIVLNLVTIVGGYVRGQIITSIMMALFTFVLLTVARVPNAIVLAAFAGLADVLPYIGGLLACGPAVLAAWPLGLPTTLTVLIALVCYQEFESRFIVPRVYGRALRLPPATVLVAFLVGGQLLGILGGLLALPVAAALRMIVEELRFELPGEDLHDTARRKADAQEERVFERLTAGAPAEQAAAVAKEIAEARLQDDKQRGKGTEVGLDNKL